MDKRLDQLLSAATRNILKCAGYDTLEKIQAASAIDLLKVPNFGRGRADEVAAALAGAMMTPESEILRAKVLLELHGYRVEKIEG